MTPFRSLVFLVGIGGVALQSLALQEKPAIALPSDPATVIISMDWAGGTAQRKNMSPVLTIRADGKATVIDPSGRVANKETVLTAVEIQDLLRFVITEQNFFSFNPADVKREIAAQEAVSGIGQGIFDAHDTVIHIKTADKDQESRFNALSFWAEHHPFITTLGQLRAIEVRLTRLVDDVKAGSK